MRNIYLNRNMKKCMIALCALLFGIQLLSAQQNPSMDENPDSINVSYVPQSFKDNWELSLSGGAMFLFDGFRYTKDLMPNRSTYDAVGGVVEIAATKWFNPYVGARIGWFTGYLPFENSLKSDVKQFSRWHNYAHIDVLWDWTTQFGGYKPNRVYDAVPYVHVGVLGNPGYNVMIGGGAGFLNRFHLNDSWLINLDIRATATSARKYGIVSGLAVDASVLIGVTYRFKERGWKTKLYNPYGDEVRRLRDENEDCQKHLKNCLEQKEDLARIAMESQQELLMKEFVTSEVFHGLPDTLEMTVYYEIFSSVLTKYEEAHMRTYLRMIELNDPNREHKYQVIGTADLATGSRATNERLSLERANAIKKVLIENGVKEEHIEVKIRLISEGDVRMARASHVIMFPLPVKE